MHTNTIKFYKRYPEIEERIVFLELYRNFTFPFSQRSVATHSVPFEHQGDLKQKAQNGTLLKLIYSSTSNSSSF